MKNLIKKAVRALYEKVVGTEIFVIGEEEKSEDKINFEKDIVEVLKKYKVYDSTNTALQKVEIKCGVGELPTVKTEVICLENLRR